MQEPKRTNLFNQDNGKEKNEYGLDRDLEQYILEQIKLYQGKAKFRICKERLMLVLLTEQELDDLANETKLDKETLIKQGRHVHRLYQIQALRDIENPYKKVVAGEYGGYIATPSSLDFTDKSWITPNVVLLSQSYVSSNALIDGNITLTGVINIGSDVLLKSDDMRFVIDHHGIYNVDTKNYLPHENQFTLDEIQESLNRHWIRSEIARNVVPFNFRTH